MKRVFLILLVGIMGLSLTGCGKNIADLGLAVTEDQKNFDVSIEELQDIIERDFQEFMDEGNKDLKFKTLDTENKAQMKENLYLIAEVESDDNLVHSIKFSLENIKDSDAENARAELQKIITIAAGTLKNKEAASSVLNNILKEVNYGVGENGEVQGHAVADHIMFTLNFSPAVNNQSYGYLLLEPTEYANQEAYTEGMDNLFKEIDKKIEDLEATPVEATVAALEEEIEQYHKPYYKERYDNWNSRISAVKDAIEAAKVSVADFGSMSKEDADAWCSSNGVKCTITTEYSDSVSDGGLMSQSKEPDRKLNEGESIKIVYSKGKQPTTEYLNALKKAESYSSNLHMSKTAIYNQLTSQYGEKFPADAAQYAIDHMYADWNANALVKAKSYQKNLNMSDAAIYDQLVSSYGEGFTPEQAQYAIDHLYD